MKHVASQIASRCLLALPAPLRAALDNSARGAELNRLFHSELFDPDATYLESPDPPPAHRFGELYEEFLSLSEQKGEGIFYTPADFVSRLVERVLDENADSPRVLDPACGGGVFLIEAFRQLSKSREPVSVMTTLIFGVDRDPVAVEITRLALLVTLLEEHPIETIPDLRANIKCGDALLGPAELGESAGFDWKAEFPQVFSAGGFDLIIGNPPYGLSRDSQIDPQENKILKQAYAKFRKGKVNKYLLFIARSRELLAENGRLSFVVPNSWLGISGGEVLRKLLLQDGSFEKLIVHDYSVFGDPNVEVVTFVINRGYRGGHISVQRECSPAQLAAPLSFSHAICLKNPGAVIPTTWDHSTPAFLNHFDENCLPLSTFSEYFQPMIALQAYAEGKGTPPQTKNDVESRPFDKRTKESSDCYPYLTGSDVKRFRIDWSGAYLRYGPWLAEPQILERFSGPRIVIREVLSRPPFRIHAAFTEDIMLYNKSVLHILCGPKGSKAHLLKLLEILNSEELSQYITFRGRKSQRSVFPKLVLEDLLDLPIPANFPDQLR